MINTTRGNGEQGKNKKKKRKKKPTHSPFCPISTLHHHPTRHPTPFTVSSDVSPSLSACTCVTQSVDAVLEEDGEPKILTKFRPGSGFLDLLPGPKAEEKRKWKRQPSFIALFWVSWMTL